jgi:hypothetical protein
MADNGDRFPTVEQVAGVALGLAFLAAVLNHDDRNMALMVATIAVVILVGGLWVALRQRRGPP